MSTLGEKIANEVIRVVPKPDDGEGGDWWVGFEGEVSGEFWDDSCQSKEIAETVAAHARRFLAKKIDDALDFDSYQERAFKLARYPGAGIGNLMYPTLGLCGEAGEVAEKVKRIIRDHNGILGFETKLALRKELGDCIWYVSALARELGFTLSEVAIENIAKLEDRRDRGVLHGSGDNR